MKLPLSFFATALAAVVLAPHSVFAQQPDAVAQALSILEQYREQILLGLALLVLVLQLYVIARGRKQGSAAATQLAEKDKEASRVRAELQESMSVLERENAKLKVALEEAQLRLTKAESESGLKSRPEHVNAELVHLLALFQEKGRLVDFLMEDIAGYTDAQVGTAARVVHQGCSAVLKEYFAIEPVHTDGEGTTVTLGTDFSPRRFRLIGQVKGEPPYTGVVLHRGWRTKEVTLPRVVAAAESRQFEGIIAPTEVEVR